MHPPRPIARPIAIDLFCGLGGWAEGFLEEGYGVIGFDIERHDYGKGGYPGQLVLQDALTLHGRQFKDVAVIVASPPCQEYSYMAMPWSRAKAKAAWYREDVTRQEALNALFTCCFRLQREASEAAGRYIPMVVENVKGAQPWVGSARWHYGSFYLWGDVPALMPFSKGVKNDGGSWFNIAHNTASGVGQNPVNGAKIPGQNWSEFKATGKVSPHWRMEGGKTTDIARKENGYQHTRHLTNQRESDAIKQHGSGPIWFDHGIASLSSNSTKRKAASAEIAKIPPPLARHIARVYKP